MADVKITGLPAATDPTGSEAFEVVQGGASKRMTLNQVTDLHDAAFAARAPAPGVWFDGVGTGGAVTQDTIAIGDGDFALSAFVKIPASDPSAKRTLLVLADSLTAASHFFQLALDTDGTLEINHYGASGTDYNRATTSKDIVADSGGEWVHIIVQRSSGSVSLRVNDEDVSLNLTTGGTPPGWDSDLGSRYLRLGAEISTSTTVTASFRNVSIHNRALSAAEVQELYEMSRWRSHRPPLRSHRPLRQLHRPLRRSLLLCRRSRRSCLLRPQDFGVTSRHTHMGREMLRFLVQRP